MGKKVKILTTFRGYPDDTVASETLYLTGATPTLDDVFAALLIAKGLADEIESDPPAAPGDGALTKSARAIPDAPRR